MVKRKSKNPMTKADRKRMNSLKKKINKTRVIRNRAMNHIYQLQNKQSMLIKRAKARRR